MSEELARLFHETYAKLAPTFGKVAGLRWDQLPERERSYRIAVADVIELKFFGQESTGEDESAISLGNEFFATNGYGVNTKQPFVALSYNGRKIAQMRPEDATNLAHNLLACAEASLGDAFLIGFLRDKIGIEMPQIAGLIHEFRAWRDEREEAANADT